MALARHDDTRRRCRIHSVLDEITDELFKAGYRDGQRETREAYCADALVEMARRAREGQAATPRRAARKSPRFLALVRADLDALVRGRAEGDEVCEIPGVGPVPATRLRELLDDSIIKVVMTKGVAVANVTHLGRGPTAAQKLALLWTQPVCEVGGAAAARRSGVRPPCSRGPTAEPHPPPRARPQVRAPPRPQVVARVGPGARYRHTPHGPTRRPPPPSPPPTNRRGLSAVAAARTAHGFAIPFRLRAGALVASTRRMSGAMPWRAPTSRRRRSHTNCSRASTSSPTASSPRRWHQRSCTWPRHRPHTG